MAKTETETLPGRSIGVIVRMNGTRDRGFGFIRDPEGNEYFLHRSACLPNALFDELHEGDGVSYHVATSPKGHKAFDLKRAELSEDQVAEILALSERTNREETRGNR